MVRKISMVFCRPAKVSGGERKFQSFRGGWNKWEAQPNGRLRRRRMTSVFVPFHTWLFCIGFLANFGGVGALCRHDGLHLIGPRGMRTLPPPEARRGMTQVRAGDGWRQLVDFRPPPHDQHSCLRSPGSPAVSDELIRGDDCVLVGIYELVTKIAFLPFSDPVKELRKTVDLVIMTAPREGKDLR